MSDNFSIDSLLAVNEPKKVKDKDRSSESSNKQQADARRREIFQNSTVRESFEFEYVEAEHGEERGRGRGRGRSRGRSRGERDARGGRDARDGRSARGERGGRNERDERDDHEGDINEDENENDESEATANVVGVPLEMTSILQF
jgi:hypothetical protein